MYYSRQKWDGDESAPASFTFVWDICPFNLKSFTTAKLTAKVRVQKAACSFDHVCIFGVQNGPHFHQFPVSVRSFKAAENTIKLLNHKKMKYVSFQRLFFCCCYCFQFKIKWFAFSWTSVLGTENRFSLFKEVS